MPPFIQQAHSQAMSGFIQLAHVGFYEGKGKTAHGISRIYCLHVAELCDLPSVHSDRFRTALAYLFTHCSPFLAFMLY